ncbi:fructose/tagatose bisphosphate aldolase [Bradyrhizobium sp. S3.9.2]
MKNLLTTYQDAQKKKNAVGPLQCIGSMDTEGIVAAAKDLQVPVVVGVSEGERELLGDRQISALVASFRDGEGLPVYLYADHTHSLESAMAAANVGFNSIVFDL